MAYPYIPPHLRAAVENVAMSKPQAPSATSLPCLATQQLLVYVADRVADARLPAGRMPVQTMTSNLSKKSGVTFS